MAAYPVGRPRAKVLFVLWELFYGSAGWVMSYFWHNIGRDLGFNGKLGFLRKLELLGNYPEFDIKHSAK